MIETLVIALPGIAMSSAQFRLVRSEVDLALVTWEPRTRIERCIASLLPGLFLARIGGKSPVEYITDERGKRMVRDTARELIAARLSRLADCFGKLARGACVAATMKLTRGMHDDRPRGYERAIRSR